MIGGGYTFSEQAEAATRPLMTAAELREHQTGSNGRNYAEADDGYSDMEAEAGRGWNTVASWGRDGWNLGDWPYVSFQVRERSGQYELQQIVEGDRTRWTFATLADRNAAVDYLFLWYSAGEDWSPVTYENREHLNAGTLRVDDRFRGPVFMGPL